MKKGKKKCIRQERGRRKNGRWWVYPPTQSLGNDWTSCHSEAADHIIHREADQPTYCKQKNRGLIGKLKKKTRNMDAEGRKKRDLVFLDPSFKSTFCFRYQRGGMGLTPLPQHPPTKKTPHTQKKTPPPHPTPHPQPPQKKPHPKNHKEKAWKKKKELIWDLIRSDESGRKAKRHKNALNGKEEKGMMNKEEKVIRTHLVDRFEKRSIAMNREKTLHSGVR